MCSLLPGVRILCFQETGSLCFKGTGSVWPLKVRKSRRSRPLAFGSIFGIDLGSLIYFWNKEKRLDEQCQDVVN